MDCHVATLLAMTYVAVPRNDVLCLLPEIKKIIPLVRIENAVLFQAGNKLAAALYNAGLTFAARTIKICMTLFYVNILLWIENGKAAA